MISTTRRPLLVGVLCGLLLSCLQAAAADPPSPAPSVFSQGNLVAWCIVPFDAKNRTPAQRAAMLQELGLTKVAYDWRGRHIPTFEEEILQYQKHGLEFFAFWSWHDSMAELVRKHGIRPQVWKTCPSPAGEDQEQRIIAACRQMMPLVEKTRALGLRLGLYNHGGWGGEPANLVAVCQRLRKNADHVGIVYNLHHGHGHIHDFAESLKLMQPYLLCLNLNGMADPKNVQGSKNKILPIGSGKHEQTMMQTILKSGYRGPIGILDHRSHLDARQSLQENLQGLQKILQALDDQTALQSFQN